MTTVTNIWVGVDVSKKRLDISIYPTGLEKDFYVTNDINGIQRLIDRISKYNLIQMVCESSSYEVLMLQMFLKHNLNAWRVEPNRIKSFIRSEGVHVKTDASDARMIALFAAQKIRSYDTIAMTAEGLQLDALSRRRDDLKVAVQAEKNRLQQFLDEVCQKSVQDTIAFLEGQIDIINTALDSLISNNPAWAQKRQLMLSVPGVGPVTSTILLAQLPELGGICDRQLASLIGLAPYTRQSGAWKGKSFISGGRAAIRKVLYMAALVSARHNPPLQAFYKKLRAAGKPTKVALIAVARKLLIILNAILHKSQPWHYSSISAPGVE